LANRRHNGGFDARPAKSLSPYRLTDEGGDIAKWFDALDSADVFATGHRWPRWAGRLGGSSDERPSMVSPRGTGSITRDLGLPAPRLPRRVLERKSRNYGDQTSFWPCSPDRQGFRGRREVDVRQSPNGSLAWADTAARSTPIASSTSSPFFFLVRFTKKPLRFFGMIGVSTFGIGALLLSYLVVDRLVLHHPLADAPVTAVLIAGWYGFAAVRARAAR